MAVKKGSLLAVLDVLQKNTDQEHILSAKDIIRLVDEQYGITIDRRTLYDNIEILEEFGYEVEKYSSNGQGYCMISRLFEPSEVLLLCNAVHASNFIPRKASDDLVNKLLSTQSTYSRSAYTDSVYMPNLRKTPAKNLFYSIEVLSQAIESGKRISFEYMHYEKDKKLHIRTMDNGEPYKYIRDPRYIFYRNERPYVALTRPDDTDTVPAHYRIDRMGRIEIMDEAVTKGFKRKDAYEYSLSKLFTYSGNNITARLRCQNRVINQMIDEFGPDVPLIAGEEESIITISAPADGIVWFAQQYMDSVVIVEPASLVNKMKEKLKTAVKAYR